MIRVGLLLVTGLAFCSPLAAQTRAEEEREVRAMWARFEELYDTGDAAGVAGLYAEDADRITLRGEVARGRAEIQAQYAAGIARREADPNTIPYHAEITIRFLRADVAILDGVSVRNAEETRQFTAIATKVDGRWLIAAGRPRGLLLR